MYDQSMGYRSKTKHKQEIKRKPPVEAIALSTKLAMIKAIEYIAEKHGVRPSNLKPILGVSQQTISHAKSLKAGGSVLDGILSDLGMTENELVARFPMTLQEFRAYHDDLSDHDFAKKFGEILGLESDDPHPSGQVGRMTGYHAIGNDVSRSSAPKSGMQSDLMLALAGFTWDPKISPEDRRELMKSIERATLIMTDKDLSVDEWAEVIRSAQDSWLLGNRRAR